MKSTLSYIRKADFHRLEESQHTYLDYTAAALYPASLLDSHFSSLQGLVLGNPSASNLASQNSQLLIESTRQEILSFFDADPRTYSVIFTPDDSAAVQIVAENFPFRRGSPVLLSADNHKSVNSIQDFADQYGASVRYFPLTSDLRLDQVALSRALHSNRRRPNSQPGLFAYPAQSNFSGVKHDLNLVSVARAAGWYTLLDASSFAGTSVLNLSLTNPDFISISFFKMFGFPTALGALIVRKEALQQFYKKRETKAVFSKNGRRGSYGESEGFENFTLDISAISSIPLGLRYMRGIGVARICEHVERLTIRLMDELSDLRWSDGRRAVRLYGPEEAWEERGGCIAFDIVRADGSRVDARTVEREAGMRKISIGVGSFENPGALEFALKGERGGLRRSKSRIGCNLLVEGTGESRGEYWGCLRASMGLANTPEDIDRLVTFLQDFCGQCVEGDVSENEKTESDEEADSDVGKRRKPYNSRLGFSSGLLTFRRKGGINAEDLD